MSFAHDRPERATATDGASDQCGRQSMPGGAGYSASKGGLRMVTRTLELAAHGVWINNLAPGMIATPITTSALHGPEQSTGTTAKIPMVRSVEVQEMDNVALFL